MHEKIPPDKGAAIGLPTVNIPAVIRTSAELQKVMADGINNDGSLDANTIRSVLRKKKVDIKLLAESNGMRDP